jgi:hypothetical protein
MIISINAENSFDKIHHPLMIKSLKKVGFYGMNPKIIKNTYGKCIANITLSRKKLKTFPLKSE